MSNIRNVSTTFENIFSTKRYFINNLDSYHGEQILKKVSKIIEKTEQSTVVSSVSDIGEHSEILISPKPIADPYEIIGTVIDPKIATIDHVAAIVPVNDCLPQMLTCGTVILDITSDTQQVKLASDYLKLLKDLLEKEQQAEQAQSVVNDADDVPNLDSKRRYLILLSTVMTWALTKPLDPDAPEMPFVETDFRKRKAHPNYKQHYNVENEVIGIARKFKSKIGALVVASGMTYGGREDALYYWFQKAWECEPFLPILGRGGNVIPIINVYDLAEIIYNLVTTFPKKLYILAVEQNVTKQREIIKPLGRIVGSGMFKCIPPEDAFLIPEINQRIYDLINLNLNMEPTYIVETMGLQWVSEMTFAENVPLLIKQFKKERELKSFKIVIYGPIMIGKSTLSRLICENYGLVYVSPDTIVNDMIKDLELRMEHWKEGEGSKLPGMEEGDTAMDDEETEDDENEREAARVTLGLLRSGRTPTDDEIIGYLRKKLLSHEAQNKGWVFDGLPMVQSATLFERGEEQDEVQSEDEDRDMFEEDMDLYANVLKKMLPDIVVSLEATDEFICEKAMRQPEDEFRVDEETVLKLLSEFRAADAPDISPLNFFDELDIHPLVVPVNNHNDYSMEGPYAEVSLRLGRPCRYAKLMEVIERAEKKEKAAKELMEAKQRKALQELEKKIKEENEEKMEYWSELYGLMREEEEMALAAAGEPMRNYLVQYIFPTLTAGLLEVAKLRPNDPIDFLAEYLFKLNPTGKMLEPGYNLQAEKILGKVKMLDEALKDLDINIEALIPQDADVPGEEATASKKKIEEMNAL
ncbi:adenylate kinase 7 [Papilio machaon]|uniref:adenylate kinase 7 n=1 Tax=Papilio machaon TaxID=76193 RepID=UPI001E66366E|nr:adenylate kinase 7 [Papilio machaon]